MALIDRATAFWRLGDPLSSDKLVDALGRGNDLTPFLRPAPVALDFRMGSNNEPNQQLFGSLAKWGKWDRLLTASEKTALAAGQDWPFTSSPTLRDSVAYFLLDEPSGSSTYLDATRRGNSLLSQGLTVQVAGPQANSKATKFDAGVSLWRSCTADLQTGNYAWTICGWVNLASKPTIPTLPPPLTLPQQIFWGQWNTAGTVSGTNLYYEPDGDTFSLDGGFPDVLGQGPAITNTSLRPTINTWYFVLAEYDPVANTLSHSINNIAANRRSLGPIQQPTPTPGKIGMASNFLLLPQFSFGPTSPLSGWDQPPNSNGICHAYLSRNSNVSFGNNSFTVWGWVKTTQPNALQTILGVFDSSTGQSEYIVQISQSQFYWVLGSGKPQEHKFDPMPYPADGNWHLFVCWYDKAAGIGAQVLDNGPVKTFAVPPMRPGTLYGNKRFLIGAASRSSPAPGQQFQGALNAIGIANGVPTTGPGGDLEILWNGGKGLVLGSPRRRRSTD